RDAAELDLVARRLRRDRVQPVCEPDVVRGPWSVSSLNRPLLVLDGHPLPIALPYSRRARGSRRARARRPATPGTSARARTDLRSPKTAGAATSAAVRRRRAPEGSC